MATDKFELRALSPLHQAAVDYPERDALVWHQDGVKHQLSYSALSQKVVAIGEQLTAQGLLPGDRLACIDVNSVELILLYWACIDTGVIFCPLSPRFPIKQLSKLIKQHRLNYIWSGAHYSPLFSSHQAKPQVPELLFSDNGLSTAKLTVDFNSSSRAKAVEVSIESPANLILTSGSSGQPKAAVHSLSNHIVSATGSADQIPLEVGDAWLLSLPLFHIGGLAIINRCALAGAAVVMQDKTLSLTAQLKQTPITHLSLVSTQLVHLLESQSTTKESSPLQGVKSLLLGGGAISLDLVERLNRLNINSFTSYGMTEMSSQITTGTASADGSCGQTITGRELKIVDEQIYVRGGTLFLGYLEWSDNQAKFNLPLEDGWFPTKDRGYWDKQGKLHILGRCDNMFVCGGENVQPEEIEAALKLHPQIDDAIVFPQTDSEFGHLPTAVIKPSLLCTEGIEQLTASDEFEQFLCDKIARFKRPRLYYPWPEVESVGLKVSRKLVIEAVLKG
ncbi:o-succinylbenzoate--CoA ligase [Shewanella woodyi]|uniref:o-succinylbenzoate--CoA ligase n=1 Tax=Shewanella woodyi TaxID=60961 RepID=UPI0007F89123|nr:o-succinylbenzoate--CoA ligase [Shewanella woodyi]